MSAPKDPLRQKWMKSGKKEKSVEQEDEFEEIEEEVTSKKKKKRRHNIYAVNVGNKPIHFSIPNEDGEREFFQLKPLGDDEYDMSAGIMDITRFSDDELESSTSYMDYLERGIIQEMNAKQRAIVINNVANVRQRIAESGTRRTQHFVMDDDGPFQKRSPFGGGNRQSSGGRFSDRGRETIEDVDLTDNRRIYNPNDSTPIIGYENERLDYDNMSDFFKNI